MFNNSSEHLFTIAPRGTGGGILSMVLSLDPDTAALNFKNLSVEQKVNDWNKFMERRHFDAHLYGFSNIGQPFYYQFKDEADDCKRYIHKAHFFEIYDERIDMLTGPKKSVGIYFGEGCVDRLLSVRPWMKTSPPIDLYQIWVYNHQFDLLKQFYNITPVHMITFSDMLDSNKFCQHIEHSANVLNLTIDMDMCQKILTDWYTITIPRNKFY